MNTPLLSLNRPYDICGIGNSVADIVAEIDMSFLQSHRFRKSYCITIDADQVQQFKKDLALYDMQAGGSIANIIHCMSVMGCKTSFLGIIADDEEGRLFEREMKKAGVETHLAIRDKKEGGTTVVFCLTTPDGDRSFASYEGISMTLTRQMLDLSFVEQSKITSLDGHRLHSIAMYDIFYEACDIAHAHKNLIHFNPADISMIELFPQQCKVLRDKSDIIICNFVEASALYEITDLEELISVMASEKKAGAVTLGDKGAYVFAGGKIEFIEALVSPNNKIDTNGAGDHFAAGFLTGLLKGLPLKSSGLLARSCALDCLSHLGARPLGDLSHLLKDLP
jgi:sugar/nucleoside kinase (ribokinase family)